MHAVGESLPGGRGQGVSRAPRELTGDGQGAAEGAQREAGRGLIPLLMGGREEDVSDETADTLGMFYVTLMTGVIAQWTFDPKTAPDADQLTEGLRQVLESVRKTQ